MTDDDFATIAKMGVKGIVLSEEDYKELCERYYPNERSATGAPVPKRSYKIDKMHTIHGILEISKEE